MEHLNVLKYLIQNKLINNKVFFIAAKNKDFGIINILLENNMHIMDYTIKDVIELGNLELVEYLVSIGAQIKHKFIINAAEHGHLDIVKYLFNILKNDSDNNSDLEEDISCIKSSIYFAAFNGHLDIIKYLLTDKDIPLNKYVCPDSLIKASVNGHINVVKYLISINVPIDHRALIFAGNENIVKYLLVNGAVCEENYKYDIDRILKELKQEIETNVSEYIGKDITSIILEFILI